MIHLTIFVGAMLAFGVSAMTGGGAGLVLIPLLGIALPAVQVPAALSIGTTAGSAARLAVFRQSVRWDMVRWFVPAALPFVVLGVWTLSKMAPVTLQFLLGAFLVGNIIAVFRKPSVERGPAPKPALLVLAGATAGFLSGFTGAVGLLFNAFYFRCGLSKEEIVATRAANEILLHVAKIGLYAAFGLMSVAAVQVGALIALAAIIAAFAASPLLGRVSENLFRRVGHAAMGAAGVMMMSSAGGALAKDHAVWVRGHVGLTGLKAKVHWHGRAASLEWKRGRLPEIERTIDLAHAPAHVRRLARRHGTGATRIVCEEVRSFGKLGHELIIFRADGKTKIDT